MTTATARPQHILFLCTHNSARSILSEALMNHLGEGRFRGFSAGSQPSGRINPHALSTLRSMGVDTRSLRSKSWDEFTGPDAIPMDLVVTVCANAAGESCPVWSGEPATVHWGYADPSRTAGSESAVFEAFLNTAMQLRERIARLVANTTRPEDLAHQASLLAVSEAPACRACAG